MINVVKPDTFIANSEFFPFKDETFKIIGLAMEVHKTLGKGFLEIVYKDALELEFQWANIPYTREQVFKIDYKGTLLKRFYSADFVTFGNIIVEVKSQKEIVDADFRQSINYLAVSKLKVGLLLNFGEDSLKFRRVIL